MFTKLFRKWLIASFTGLGLAASLPFLVNAQDRPAGVQPAGNGTVRLTLEEAKQQALANNKLLNLASMNVDAKNFVIKAARADYLPKITANSLYFHFDEELGTVLSTPGRTITGPLGKPLVTLPSASAVVPVLNQDSSFTQIALVQPLTDVFKIRQGVKIATADRQIAEAQWQKGIREVASAVEQLYWGLLTVRKLEAGAADSIRQSEKLAENKTLEARLALAEARQGLQQATKQANDLQEQLNGLLDLPLNTKLEVVEPAPPTLTFASVDEVIAAALAASPEICEALHTIEKANAGLEAGKLDFAPSIGLTAGYVNQTAADYIQPNIGYVGVAGTWTLFNGGKRAEVVRERKTLVAMAHMKLHQTEDDVRQKAAKAYREFAEAQESLKLAAEMVGLRREVEKQATTMADAMSAGKARMLAEVDAVKADLAVRIAHVQLMSLTAKQ